MFVMHESEIRMMEESFDRIILFFTVWFRWIFAFFNTKPIVSTPESKIVVYGEKYKEQLLLTYQDGSIEWNSNIDPVISDASQLTDANNPYEKGWRARILIENTPRGNVIMFYDIYKQAFSYYCDSAVMPYEIINAVAMKYVLMFRCRDFFVDSQIIPKREVKEETNDIKTNIPFSAKKTDKDAFVKFKTYNNATKKAGISPEDDKVINKFLHLGASRNWIPISKKAKANPINGFKTNMIPDTNDNKISYLDYKRMKQTT